MFYNYEQYDITGAHNHLDYGGPNEYKFVKLLPDIDLEQNIYLQLFKKNILNLPENTIGEYSIKYSIIKGNTYPYLYHNLNNEYLNKIITHSYYSDRNFVYEYMVNSQDILIVSLGLGIVPSVLTLNKNIRTITVLEDKQEIIDLVAPHLNDKIKVIKIDNIKNLNEPKCNHIYDYIPEKKYDILYNYNDNIYINHIVDKFLPYCYTVHHFCTVNQSINFSLLT